MKICQVINALDRADAVSACLLETDRMLRDLGHSTEIYFEFVHRSLASRGRPIAQLQPDAGDIVLFHYAGFSRILPRVARFHGKRGVIFHNVTPAHFFEDVPETYEFCRRAVAQLPELPKLFDFGIGVSAFNAGILREHGFSETRVLPIAWETSGLSAALPDSSVASGLRGEVPTILMVGRVAPHKGVHYAVRALDAIERRLGREARLVLVGRTSGYDAYLAELRRSIAESSGAERIWLVGEVSVEELRAYYASADVLLQLSEHEGFCVPLVEAMALDVPIVAARAGAVEETLGGAGLLLADRSSEEVARGVTGALGEERDRILATQRKRREAFTRSAVRAHLETVIHWAAEAPRIEVAPRLPSFSVVVCTYNRAQVLGRCLEALRRLDYPEFEVVVVEGPSTDHTKEVLDRFPDVKRVTNETRNLSVSRNLGIAAAAGEIVAFIDDDAVPDCRWLRALAEAFDDPTVGGAGGDVFGPGGDHLQFTNGTLSRYGRVIAHGPVPQDRNDPGGAWYNTLMGTNSSFRRRTLEEVGGFDENYEYYHDEADLCVRVIQAGHRVEHVPQAVVWHGFEPGAARKNPFVFDFTVIVKNSIYFAFCVSGWQRRPWRVLGPLPAVSKHPLRVLRWLLLGKIGLGQASRSWAGWARGVAQGFTKGFTVPPRRNLAAREPRERPALLPYGRASLAYGRERLHVALVSQQYPPDECGGIGVYTEQLARGLLEEGHRVSVLASGPEAAIDSFDGIDVYRIPPAEAPSDIPRSHRVTRKNLARALGVNQILAALVRGAGVQVVESPIWDGEGFVAALAAEVPLVLRLNTPLALGAEMQDWEWNDDFARAAEMEWSLLRQANAVIDPSGTILETIQTRYGVGPSQGVPTAAIPFGTPVPALSASGRRESDDAVRFLFLGRLEPRKGIDALLEAIPVVLEACPTAFFEIAGDAPGGVEPATVAAGLPAACRERMRFHGFVDDAERSELYGSSDVFVAPSRYESFGIVYLEAMAHGLPCVACNVGGPKTIVLPGETGTLVPPDDGVALASALIELARSENHRRAMGRAARKRIEDHYDLRTMVRRTIDLYEDVLALHVGDRAAG